MSTSNRLSQNEDHLPGRHRRRAEAQGQRRQPLRQPRAEPVRGGRRHGRPRGGRGGLARVAVESINEFVCLTGGDEEITWPFGLDENISYDGNRLKTAIRYANRKVLEATKEKQRVRGHGHHGGGRARGRRRRQPGPRRATAASTWSASGQLQQLTSDHSWVNEQLQSGIISADQARSHPLRNVVTRALGGKPDLQVDMQVHKCATATCCCSAPTGSPPWSPTTRSRALLGEAGGDVEKAAQAPGRRRQRAGRRGQHHGRADPSSRSRRCWCPPTSDARRPRRRIGKYALTGRIGRGGMGMVYRGLRRGPRARGGGQDPDRRGHRSTRRAASASRSRPRRPRELQHPNIVTVFELGEDRGVPFIAMELLPGVDLETLLRSGEALLLQEKLEIVIQVCRGLRLRARARDRPPRHQALATSACSTTARVKIMDFGIAKLGGTGVTKQRHDGGHRPLHEPGADPGPAAGRAQRRVLGRA